MSENHVCDVVVRGFFSLPRDVQQCIRGNNSSYRFRLEGKYRCGRSNPTYCPFGRYTDSLCTRPAEPLRVKIE